MTSTTANVKRLLDLIDREGHYPHEGHNWLKADQPYIAKRCGFSVRTLRTTIKHPAIETLRTQIDKKVVTLLRRAVNCTVAVNCNPKPIRQNRFGNSATDSAKSIRQFGNSANVTEGMQALKRAWIGSLLTKGERPNYGILRQLEKDGVTPDMLQTVVCHWRKFQTFCGVRAETRHPELKRIRVFSWRIPEFCAALQEERQKAVDEFANAL